MKIRELYLDYPQKWSKHLNNLPSKVRDFHDLIIPIYYFTKY